MKKRKTTRRERQEHRQLIQQRMNAVQRRQATLHAAIALIRQKEARLEHR